MTPAGRWAAWAALTALTFAALEAPALHRHDSPATLTSCTRALLGLEPRRPRYHLRVAAFYGALLWLGAHMTSGKWGVTIWAAGDPILDLGDGD